MVGSRCSPPSLGTLRRQSRSSKFSLLLSFDASYVSLSVRVQVRVSRVSFVLRPAPLLLTVFADLVDRPLFLVAVCAARSEANVRAICVVRSCGIMGYIVDYGAQWNHCGSVVKKIDDFRPLHLRSLRIAIFVPAVASQHHERYGSASREAERCLQTPQSSASSRAILGGAQPGTFGLDSRAPDVSAVGSIT